LWELELFVLPLVESGIPWGLELRLTCMPSSFFLAS
jgi:hypothetical protein